VQAYCRLCYRVYWREYYHKNKPGHQRRARRRTDAIRILIRSAKDRPCADCGKRFPYYVMQFDHRDDETKCFNIGGVNSRRRVSKARLLAELAKCDVVCANCHCERTHQRKKRRTGQQTIKDIETLKCCCSSVVEHVIGNDEVLGSSPNSSSS
jgi:hypothetical protein